MQHQTHSSGYTNRSTPSATTFDSLSPFAALVLPGAFEVYLLLGKARIHGSLVRHGRGKGFAFVLALYGLWR